MTDKETAALISKMQASGRSPEQLIAGVLQPLIEGTATGWRQQQEILEVALCIATATYNMGQKSK